MELVLSIDCNYWANATHKGWLRKESELSGLPPPDVDSIVRLLTIEDLNGLLQKEKLGNSVLPKVNALTSLVNITDDAVRRSENFGQLCHADRPQLLLTA